MTWAARRQLLYFFYLIVVVGIIAFLVIRNATHMEPTCYDGKRNGDEVGIDCGGACTFYCRDELQEPKLRWRRFFEVAPGLVHAVAYIEHSYPSAAAQTVPYTFYLYDEKNNLITARSGTTYLGPMGRSAIVETLIPVGNSVPSVARFEFSNPIPWEKISGSFSQAVIKTDRTLLESFATDASGSVGTRLTATLDNQSRISFEDIDVVAILYDKNDNAIAVSKSVLSSLKAQESATVYFTWPTRLDKDTVRVEVIPRINPFTSTR